MLPAIWGEYYITLSDLSLPLAHAVFWVTEGRAIVEAHSALPGQSAPRLSEGGGGLPSRLLGTRCS